MGDERLEIHLSVITSIAVAGGGAAGSEALSAAAQALDALGELEVGWVDLYCFLRDDLTPRWVAPGDPAACRPVASLIGDLDVQAVVASAERGTLGPAIRDYITNRKVQAIATNLPNISSPIPRLQKDTVEALKKLLSLASAIQAPVVEVVGGPDFLSKQGVKDEDLSEEVKSLPYTVTTGPRAIELRYEALLNSLTTLNNEALALRPPVVLALEIEPGLSYLLNSWENLSALFTRLDTALGAVERRVFLNLDIGHVKLLAEHDPALLEKFSSPEWTSRIVHAHISHHEPGVHMADLPLQDHHRSTYQPWIDLVVNAWHQETRNPFASNTIALELEAGRTVDVKPSLRRLRRWVDDSVKRHPSRVRTAHGGRT